jgi:biotin synthase
LGLDNVTKPAFQEVLSVMADIEQYLKQVLSGEDLSFEQALDLAENTEPAALHDAADRLRKKIHGNHFDLCSIINARSGMCSENCRFCSQSSRYQTDVTPYDKVSYDEVQRQGKENEQAGVGRFSLVTAGREVSSDDIDSFSEMYEKLGEESGLYFCASMGFLTREKAARLVASGVKRYHCNLETCRSFFPEVCTTHTWEQKVETIKTAREAGMDICSGGIIGLGETFEQRLELAFELRELGVFSIPINILTPIAGTPFAEKKPLSLAEVLTCIAAFRFINPHAVVRLAGGRSQLGADQYRCFLSGANGAIVGNYLTTAGNNIEEDLSMIESIGFSHGQPEKD